MPDLCEAMVVMGVPLVNDNCAMLSLTNDYTGMGNGNGIYPVGETQVIWTGTDIHGNTQTCAMTVTVNDVQAPYNNECGQTYTFNNDLGMCGAMVNYTLPEVVDNCGEVTATLISGPAIGADFPVGITEVVYNFADSSGNSIECTFFIEVIDIEAPFLFCPESITVNNDPGVCGAIVNYAAPMFQDNCGTDLGTVTLISGLPSGFEFPLGITMLTFEAVDNFGNITECSFEINVIDSEAPQIVCSDDMIVEDPIAPEDGVAVDYELPEYSDNCAALLTLISGPNSGEIFLHGYTEVTYTATDAAGLADTCTFQVLVNNAPTAVNDYGDFMEEDNVIVVDILGDDFDVDNDSIYISGIEAGAGEVTLNDNGTISYSVDPELWCGMDTIWYTVCDIYNACDTGFVAIDVECFLDIIIPEGISPNGDGQNDVFEIIGLEDFPDNTLTVFNRWGHMVYQKRNYSNDWDGTSESPVTIGNGMLPKGTYFYVLDLEEYGTKKGYFFLNR
jgi:gliding motility-associated-like protein